MDSYIFLAFAAAYAILLVWGVTLAARRGGQRQLHGRRKARDAAPYLWRLRPG